jgi:RNA polymerase sigma-70 factor (ECF subfamily)
LARRRRKAASLGELVEWLVAAPGDGESSAALDAALRPRLGAYFRAGGVEAGRADDLVQETLRRVFSGVAGLESAASFEGWVFTIARNVLRTQGARRARDPLAKADTIDDDGPALRATKAPDPETRLLAEERIRLCERALRELPARQRQCLLLQVRQELTYEEIAETLALSVNTVRNHLAQARAALRRALEQEGP